MGTTVRRGSAVLSGKVVVANNYSLLDAQDRWQRGDAPVVHLWGGPSLARAGFEVSYLPLKSGRLAARASRAARDRLGELAVERRALRAGADLLYAADPMSFAGLAAARSYRLLRTPVMAVVHPDSWRGLGKDRGLRGYDEVVTLSQRVRDELVRDLGRSADRTTALAWGPDLDFAGYRPAGEEVIVCSGKTQRDTGLLLAALDRAGLTGRVHVPAPMPYRGASEIVVGASYDMVLADLCRASLVAIPLASVSQGSGITELNDALALGKPVLMTRNPYVDVDIERIGCGRWLERGDLDGWVTALREVASDPRGWTERGARGRAFAEQSHHAGLFGEGLAQIALRAVGRG